MASSTAVALRNWSGWRWAAPVLVAVGGAVVLWLRLDPVARQTLWAEDGAVFLDRAAHPAQLPLWIFTPYDGYTHALPQSIALILWGALPAAWFASAVTVVACAVAGAVAGGVFAFTARWGMTLGGRLLLAGITVLAPNLSAEVAGNLANLHWFLLWLTPFALLVRPRTWPGAAGMGVLLFVIGTSEVQSLLFAPLLLWRIRERRRWPMAAGLVGAGVVQLAAILAGSRDRGSPPSLSSLVDGYFLQTALTAIVGTGRRASLLVAHVGWIVAYAAIVPFLACAVWFAWRSRRRALLVGLFLVSSVGLWSAGFIVNYAPTFDYARLSGSGALGGVSQLRYAVVPVMFLLGTVALAIGRRRPGRGRADLSPAALVALALTVVVLGASFGVSDHPQRADGPIWSEEVDASAACGQSGESAVRIPIAPQGWSVDLPCASLTR